ncbi:heavy chain [Halocaridina rubra]|uniref:Heavy chain n=1 Tax=Halocaridina rubra TaxID=373956 RepID=A0AAN8XM55_HALRR
MSIVEGKRSELRELEERLEELQRRFSISCKEKEKLENDQKLCALKLDRAKKLISGLGGEKTRWEAAAQTATDDLLRLPGDTLIAAASLAYLGPHQPDIRDQLREDWCLALKESELEVSEPFNLVSALTPPLHIRAWGLEGLPTDTFSLQNATIIKHTEITCSKVPENIANQFRSFLSEVIPLFSRIRDERLYEKKHGKSRVTYSKLMTL